MKKFLAASAIVASIGFGALSAEAKTTESKSSAVSTTANAVEPQVRVQIGRNRNRNWRNRRVRVVTTTRIVRVGRQRYRETIQTRYLPNGRTQTRVISRVRIR